MSIICRECGSEDVEIRTWISCGKKIETSVTKHAEFLIFTGDLQQEDCWCNKCEEHTILIIKT